jgi:RimJ/RimL family protein N-acetyltransferase
MNFWQGKHVRLRSVEPSDAAIFFEWKLDSEITRNMKWKILPPESQTQVGREIEEHSQKKFGADSFLWVIEDDTCKAAGSIRTHTCNPHNGTFSYGISIAREHHRKGYATEAIQLILRYYFGELRYQKVNAQILCCNDASIALHKKLGFVREGMLRRMTFTDGNYYDMYWYGMTKEEWEQSILFIGMVSP